MAWDLPGLHPHQHPVREKDSPKGKGHEGVGRGRRGAGVQAGPSPGALRLRSGWIDTLTSTLPISSGP